ncbi:hypothetical protein NQ317_009898 [Molorchus minor]|uniref:Uncharacterized protein n=1 Tax=Molorchus minor TaxID=1323400 RepID=A0ABQ9IUE5_9CUCU|nr:hypothetical protein NQ317_009898 [Molorchus minor]
MYKNLWIFLVDIFYERSSFSVRCLSCLKGQGKLSRSCPNNISINSHKNTEDGMKKMAEMGQEEGKQNIRIEGALLLIQYKR